MFWFDDMGGGEPHRLDNELSNINSWREIYEKDEAALRPHYKSPEKFEMEVALNTGSCTCLIERF